MNAPGLLVADAGQAYEVNQIPTVFRAWDRLRNAVTRKFASNSIRVRHRQQLHGRMFGSTRTPQNEFTVFTLSSLTP